jgi:hypothetical protein
VEVYINSFFDLSLDGGKCSASRPGRVTPRERAPGTHWTRGWVGLRAVLDAVVKRNIPSPRRESNPRTPIVQPIAQRYTDWAITAPVCNFKTRNFIMFNPESCLGTCMLLLRLTISVDRKSIAVEGPWSTYFQVPCGPLRHVGVSGDRWLKEARVQAGHMILFGAVLSFTSFQLLSPVFEPFFFLIFGSGDRATGQVAKYALLAGSLCCWRSVPLEAHDDARGSYVFTALVTTLLTASYL